MKTNPHKSRFLPAGVLGGVCLLAVTSVAQSSIYNIYDALARSETTYNAFTYNPGGATIQSGDNSNHIQGVGYYNGYYYITRSRPSTSNNQKLLIVSESTESVVNMLTLDTGSRHPGGFQIHNGYLAVPFEVSGASARINFYSLATPTAPTLAASFTTSVGNGYCVGMTDYQGKYLVAHYYSRSGSIRFYHFDSAFNKVAERPWTAPGQADKSGWYPYSDWRTGDYNYEAMSLLKVQAPGSATPSYYMIMYHNTDSADVFALSDPNLASDITLTMIYSLKFTPSGPGMRYGAGVSITDENNLLFFSSLKHVMPSKSQNVISVFESRPAWPWKLPYNYTTGGIGDVAINESGVCVELHRGSPGGSNAFKIYSQVGTIDSATRKVSWGSGVDTGMTGDEVSVALNASGHCVALVRNGNQHSYRVGQVNATTKTITWGTQTNYQTGGNLSVAMDDSNHVVEVHRGSAGGSNENKHYYRVGTLNPTAKTISWLASGTQYDTGGGLSVAVDNNGHCLEVHRGSPGTGSANTHFYRTGTINYSTGVITWGSTVNYDTGGEVDISLDNSGRCVEVHRGSPGQSNANNHYYKIGTANFSTGLVSWSSGGLFSAGGSIAVAIDNLGNGINVHLGVEGSSSSNKRHYQLISVP